VEVDRTACLSLRCDHVPSSGEEGSPLFKSTCDARVNNRLEGARMLTEGGLDGRETSEGNFRP